MVGRSRLRAKERDGVRGVRGRSEEAPVGASDSDLWIFIKSVGLLRPRE